MEKLDAFNKILIATGTINYMASALNGVNEQIKSIPEGFEILEKGIKERDRAINRTLKRLCNTIEELGNFLDSRDCVCTIDQRVYKEPLRILLHGMDEVQNDYEEGVLNQS